jgi:hypothetical protein
MSAFTRWLALLGPCVLVGIFAGAVVGFIFELLRLSPSGHMLSVAAALRTGIWLGVFAWLAALLFFGALAGLGIGQIALPALVTCLATSIVTVLIDNVIAFSVFFVFVGIAAGYLIGRALCAACDYLRAGSNV